MSMRAQLSIELLAYLSLTGVSALFIAGAIHKGQSNVASLLGDYESSILMSRIDSLMLTGVGDQEITAFLPKGMCNSSLSNGMLLTKYGNFSLPFALGIPHGVLCPDGTESVLLLSYLNGSYVLSRVS